MFHGIGAPHTSLANTAVSTPDMNREAKWIPRGNTFGSWIKWIKINCFIFYDIQIKFIL